MKKSLYRRFITITVLFFVTASNALELNVKDFGAIGDGKANDQKAINSAINACSQSGGGKVVFPRGVYKTATIRLKSGVILRLEGNAVILGTSENVYDEPETTAWHKYQDFGHSHFQNALIFGRDIENIGIEGPGRIDGGGLETSNDVKPKQADKGISLVSCRNVKFQDLTITRCGHFGILLNDCNQVTVTRMVVEQYHDRDGVNIVSSKNIQISNCIFNGEDDALALKSDYALGRKIDVENVFVKNCQLKSKSCNAFQIGSETSGDFKNIDIQNCLITEAGKAAIGITSNDGGVIENLRVENINISKVAAPFYLSVTDRLRTPEDAKTGQIRNCTFKNITVSDVYNDYARTEAKCWASTINGMTDSAIENLLFENVRIEYKGTGQLEDRANHPPDPAESYQPRKLGVRPAYAWYIRHAKNIRFHNCHFSYEKQDRRPAFFLDNVHGFSLDSTKIRQYTGDPSVTLLRCDDIRIQNCIYSDAPFE